MTHQLISLMRKTIVSGLQRKAVKSASRWAETYRVMGNPFPGLWTFDHHPWLLEMHDAEESKLVGQKAAQVGFTEWALNLAFYSLDVLSLNVLYILPTTDDAGDFSAARFDPALEMSPHLRTFFTNNNNVKLKRAGNQVLYVRGSHSRSKLKSIPVPVLIFDEYDEMPKGTGALAEERQSGQQYFKSLFLSTPTIENFGINGEYKSSTQEHFVFKCPSCSRHIELVFPDCLIVTGERETDQSLKDSHLICLECKNRLPHETKKTWLQHKIKGGTAQYVPSFTDRDVRGFHVNQFYSMADKCHPRELAIASIRARTDPTRAQEYYNSKGGIPFEADGARVSHAQIQSVIGTHVKGPNRTQNVRTFGMDVGSVLHIVVKEFLLDRNWHPGISLNDTSTAKVLFEGKSTGGMNDFGEAYQIFMDFACNGGVVDAEPERRAALQFAQKLWGRILLCDYIYSQTGREAIINEEEASIKVNRTSWLDMTLGRYRNKSIILPANVSDEFREHVRAPVRVFKEDKFGNKYGVYVNKDPDHFAHASNYAEIAYPFCASLVQNHDLTTYYK